MMRLLLLRHAKSSWDDPDLSDEDRPLAPRGERAAEKMRRYLASEDLDLDVVLCSAALRARQTFARVLPSLGTELEIKIEPILYTFDAQVLLDRLRQIPGAGSVLLVGHNPALQDLALRLADRGGRLEELAQKFPTGAFAEIGFGSGSWSTLPDPLGELTRFVVPGELDVS